MRMESIFMSDSWAFRKQQILASIMGTRRPYFVTMLILTPNTPLCFLDGVLFKLRSRLVNFMENSTLICGRTNNTAEVNFMFL